MDINLSLNETRVLGALMEKEVTTPDQYPLSLNALVSACNQKSNREPVMNLTQADVETTIEILIRKRLLMAAHGHSARVSKYQQRFSGTEFSVFDFSPAERAILCILFLRGPQTPGEIRGRSQRMWAFDDVRAVENALQQLEQRPDGPFVRSLPREPGRRESRYAHLFSGLEAIPEPQSVAAGRPEAADAPALEDRVRRMEAELARLGSELAALKDELPRED